MERNFIEMLEERWSQGKFVCVGLDSELNKIPVELRYNSTGEALRSWVSITEFNKKIVEATHDIACSFKPNLAFYIAHGEDGLFALKTTIEKIHHISNVPVILDAKFADIGNTNKGYVEFAFDYLKADAVTVHPYLGAEALEPFLERKDKGIFVLCRTSNPGASEFQDMYVSGDHVPEKNNYFPLYQYVAHRVKNYWNKNNNCGLVVGATYPSELKEVRELVGNMPILIPGIGAQGGDLEKTIEAGKDSRGTGMIINSSRGIIFASNGKDFAEASANAAKKLRDEINLAIALATAPPCSTCGSIMIHSGTCWKCKNCGARAGF